MTFTDFILQKFDKDFFKGRTIYDIGCHDFKETQKFLVLDARIVGLDQCIYANTPHGIDFLHENFLNWKPQEPIDILYMANVALFMKSKTIFNKIDELNPKMIMVQTMYGYPEPNWPPELLKKLYFTNADEWEEFFSMREYKTLHAKSYEKEQKDLIDTHRLFKFTEYIGQK